MKKKVKALFFAILVLSNINLLAHTFVPHHYHENKVCNENVHCQTHSQAHTHGTASHNHEHDEKNDPDYCISDQVFVIRSSQTRLDNLDLDLADYGISFELARQNFSNPELINFLTKYSYNTQPPSVFFTHSQFITTGIGMRAPPIV